MSASKSQAGFTLLEAMLTAAALTIILVAILSTSGIVGNTVRTGESVADVAETLRTVSARIRRILRPGVLSTIKSRAQQVDVDAEKARKNALIADAKLNGTAQDLADAMAYPIPAIGDWITPESFVNQPNIQFRTAPGTITANIRDFSALRSFEFVLDESETANGLDDDGDGLVDEGRLYLDWQTARVQLVGDSLEECRFTLSGKVMTVSMTCARRDSQKRVHRLRQVQTIHIRNN